MPVAKPIHAISGAVLIVLSACGGQDDEAIFLAACQASGTSAETCACEFRKAESELPEYTFGVMVEASKITDGPAAVKFLTDNLSRDQQTTYFQSRMRWIVECNAAAESALAEAS
ncbi:MAG: hypothetical protein AAFR41_06700 [Pseudomonadota bacterium]